MGLRVGVVVGILGFGIDGSGQVMSHDSSTQYG